MSNPQAPNSARSNVSTPRHTSFSISDTSAPGYKTSQVDYVNTGKPGAPSRLPPAPPSSGNPFRPLPSSGSSSNSLAQQIQNQLQGNTNAPLSSQSTGAGAGAGPAARYPSPQPRAPSSASPIPPIPSRSAPPTPSLGLPPATASLAPQAPLPGSTAAAAGLTARVPSSSRLPPAPSGKRGPSGPGDAPGADNQRVKVSIRIRPAIKAEETAGVLEVFDDGNRLRVHRGLSSRSMINWSDFGFDFVLPPTAGQGDIYEIAARPVVEDVLKGYNGCVMAYGQTGAGKTYTVSSLDPDHVGVMPRAIAEIFMTATLDVEHHYTVYMSYVQIYMEEVQDLLRPECVALQMREDPSGGVYLEGVQEVQIRSVEECLQLLQLGERNRVYALTSLNAHSSRSHAVVIFTVEKRKAHVPRGEEKAPRKVTVGRLYMVDLAGSERLKKSRSEGLRASEAKAINLSLTTLGMCINARADPTATHVPFRDSKLTRLLQESIGGNAKTSLILCVPDVLEHVEETVSSLQFGSRAMQVKVHARVNEVLDTREITDELLSQAHNRVVDDVFAKRELEAQAERVALETRLSDIRRQLDSAESDRLAWARRAQEDEARLQELGAQNVELMEINNQLEAESASRIASLESDLAARTGEREELAARLAASEIERAEWEEHRRGLEESLDKATARVAYLEDALSDEQHRGAALSDTVRQLEGGLREAAARGEEIGAEASERAAEIARLRGVEADQATTIASLRSNLASTQAALAESESQAAAKEEDLSARLANAESVMASLESDKASQSDEIERLKKRIEELEAEVERLRDGHREGLAARATRDRREKAAVMIQKHWRQYKNGSTLAKLTMENMRKFMAQERQKQNLLFWAGARLVSRSIGLVESSSEAMCRYFLLPKKEWEAERSLAKKSYIGNKPMAGAQAARGPVGTQSHAAL